MSKKNASRKIFVRPDAHKKIKEISAIKGLTMGELVESAIPLLEFENKISHSLLDKITKEIKGDKK